MKYIDINNWNRKEHYEFFKDFDEPFWGIVANIDCTKAYKFCKENKISFFAYYLHKSLQAINSVEEFRYRIVDDKIAVFDIIHAAATIGREDGTFAFTLIKYIPDFNEFSEHLQDEIKKVQKSKSLYMYEDKLRKDVIYYSSTPWLKFTGLTHAKNYNTSESTPMITFGKSSVENDKRTMPVSINAHHALTDGLHASKYYDTFQELMDSCNI